MRFMLSVVVVALISGLTTAKQAKDGESEADLAKAQIAILGKAVDAYRLKNTKFPINLKALVEQKLVQPHAILDPWDNEFQYDVTGKRNDGKKPDIWAVSPSEVTIGNWVEKKK
jgi:Type II secretion system (T2SS), protein G